MTPRTAPRSTGRLAGRITALTLAGTLVVGGTALAAGGGDGDGSGPTGGRAAKVCNHLGEIDDWLASRIAEVQHHIDYFTTMRAKAEAAGRTNLVTRLDRAVSRLNDRLVRLQNRLSEIDTWAASHCTVTTTTTPSTEPPATEPPATEPPATEAPATDAPATAG